MPHTITFVRSYKSITSINSIELPDVTIITGANGSGKSHLLRAISLGYVSTSETSDYRRQISIFDWNTIVPSDNEAYSIASSTAKIDEAMKRLASARGSVLANIQHYIDNNGQLDRNLVLDFDDLQTFCDPNYSQYLQTEQERNTAVNVQSWMIGVGQNFANSISNNDYGIKKKVREIWQKDYRLLMFGDMAKIREQINTEEDFSLNLFSQAFAKIFVDYMHRWQKNTLSKSSGEDFLTEDEFIAVNQIPPWDFVNSILEESRLPFRITSPSKSDITAAFEPKLIKMDSAVEMRFSDLSSGEKVLMSFALCVYNATGKNPITFPRLLLLDEVDAPLHPEMVGVMLRLIQRILVYEHKIKVMLTTHKPTTVALAPEGSIYQVLQPGPELIPISREKAVSVLTVGVPTMAFTTDMRLQVFTEGSVDATCFGKMYQIFKSQLTSNRSIEFIQSGRRTLSGDVDSGRSRVNHLVSELRSAGASTVLGLVDWDGRSNDVSWVHELCKGKRHSIENLFLDPVIVVALLAKDFVVLAKQLGLIRQTESYIGIVRWDEETWQAAVDLLGTHIFELVEEKADVNYTNGMALRIDKRFLVMRGHDLVQLITTKMNGALRKYADDKLLAHISESVIPDIQNLVPADIVGTLEELLRLGEAVDG
jgi:ABC-type transport system involved in cytochrome c biogenesis ATPase subunit